MAAFFHGLPPPTALLIASIRYLAVPSHALHSPLARPTSSTSAPSVPHRAVAMIGWPTPLAAFGDLRRRQAGTICGYVGGDADLPATCSAGSHCVLDPGAGVVGCCPDGQDSCSTGVYTTCVEGPQESIDPYAFTCTVEGSRVCYKNVFEGGYSQFGCGKASNVGTSVAVSASGATAAAKFSIVSVSGLSADGKKLTTGRSSAPASPTSPAFTGPTTAGSSVTATPTNEGGASRQTGTIVGGVIGGVIALVALVAAAFCLWRHNKNKRRGPGGPGGKSGPTMTQSMGGGGVAGFSRLRNIEKTAGYKSNVRTNNSYPPSKGYHYPGQYPAAYAAVAHAADASHHEHFTFEDTGDQVPFPRRTLSEADDFSIGAQATLGHPSTADEMTADSDAQAGGSDRRGGTVGAGGIRVVTGGPASVKSINVDQGSPSNPPSIRGGTRPLWQQQRTTSRNLMLA